MRRMDQDKEESTYLANSVEVYKESMPADCQSGSNAITDLHQSHQQNSFFPHSYRRKSSIKLLS